MLPGDIPESQWLSMHVIFVAFNRLPVIVKSRLGVLLKFIYLNDLITHFHFFLISHRGALELKLFCAMSCNCDSKFKLVHRILHFVNVVKLAGENI